MLEVNDFIVQRGGNPDKIRESQRRRFASVEVVDEIIKLWEEALTAQYAVTQSNAEINSIQKQIGQRKKAKEDASQLLEQKQRAESQKKAKEVIAIEKQSALHDLVKTVGNYVSDSVPISEDEDDNQTIRSWAPEGFVAESKPGLMHHEVLARLDGYDPVRGIKLAGHRGFCLTGYGLFLNMALINYGLEFLFNRGYSPNQPPYFLNRDQMAKTAQLSQFHDELYRVTEGSEREENLKYLIATSEQPLSCLHADEWLLPSQLPIKYCGYSTCFRKEAGSGGRDTFGIFRVHQFEKVEQFIICPPDKSWSHFEDMLSTSEDFYKSLGLPYKLVSIVSGALNNAAARKVDLEAFFPVEGRYRELVSCSNCTDYQTRELGIRYLVQGNQSEASKQPKAGGQSALPKEYVHALNATLCATQRTLCCLLETYQTPEGFTVPEVLRKYIPGQPDFIPYIKSAKELPRRPAN